MNKLETISWLKNVKEFNIPDSEKLCQSIEKKLLNIQNEDITEHIPEIEDLNRLIQKDRQFKEEIIEKLEALNPSSYMSELILKDPMEEIKMHIEKLSAKALNEPTTLAWMGTKYKLTFKDEVTNMLEGIVGRYYKDNTELINNKLENLSIVPELEETPKIVVQSAITYVDTKQDHTGDSTVMKTILSALRESVYPLLSISFILMFLGIGTIFSVFKDFFLAHQTYKWIFLLAVIVSVIWAVIQFFKKPKLPDYLLNSALSTMQSDLLTINGGLHTKYLDAVNNHFTEVINLFKTQKKILNELIF